MKRGRSFTFVVSLGCLFLSSIAFSDSSYQIPLDGGRAFNPSLENQAPLGYIVVSSLNASGELNSSMDQESVDQLLEQLSKHYLEIYTKYKNRMVNGPKSYRLPEKKGPTSCSHRRAARWRQS